jgi:hypothetical protein
MNDSERKRLEALVTGGMVGAKNQEAAKNTLALLFPKVEQSIETSVSSDDDINARRRKRRISLIDFSKSYFALSPDSNSWGQKEFEAAIKMTPAQAFTALQTKLDSASPRDQSDLRRIFIELLDSEFGSTRELTEDWLNKLVEESPKLILNKDEESKFLFSFDNKDRLRWLIVNALARLPVERVNALIKTAIQSATDLTLLTDIVRGIAGDSHPEGGKREPGRVNFGNETESIQEMLIARIRDLARTGEIWNQSRPDELLWFWWGLNKEDEVKAFTAEAMNTPAGLRGLLGRSPSTVVSSSGNYERVSPIWRHLVDLDELRRKAVALMRTGDEAELQLVERFLAALERGQRSSFD